MIITDYPACEIQMQDASAVYERPCSLVKDPTEKGRWDTNVFVFFPDDDTRIAVGFTMDTVESGMFNGNVLNVTTWKRGQGDKGVEKQYRSRDAYCVVRNGKPSCSFTLKTMTFSVTVK